MASLAELGASIDGFDGHGKSLEEAISGHRDSARMLAWLESSRLARAVADPGKSFANGARL
jgi:hypothetical protein